MSVVLNKKDNIIYIEFDQKDSKVNVLTSEVIRALDTLLDEIKRDTSAKAVVFLSRKKDVFIAGADIKEIESMTECNDATAKAQAGQNVFNKIEDLKIPTIAFINGVALGGGCELALSCNYRVATGNEKIKIGLPEVGLGFVPGFGGTYRLPRIVGLSTGLGMILRQEQVNSSKALRIGLVDQLFSQNGYETNLYDFVLSVIKGKFKTRKVKKTLLEAFMDDSIAGNYLLFSMARKSILKSPNRFYPAPLKAIETIRKNYFLGRSDGLALESAAFGDLAVTQISKNLVSLFYLRQKYQKLTAGKDAKPSEISKCGVLGAGVMGGGIAQLLSSHDIHVRLKDINPESILQAFQVASKIYQKGVEKRKISKAQADLKMGFISSALDYSGFGKTDMVIEAVIENMDIKKKVFKELSSKTSKDTILATNTSALSVAEMAKEVDNPSRVIGLHFFNPVFRMPLVEIITTEKTSVETVATTLQLVKKLGKTPIIVKDSCGFVVNRILLAYINEAGRLLEETGDMAGIDKSMTDFGMPMGPFLLSDEVGLDVGFKVLNILDTSFSGHFKPVDIFEKLYSKGWFGKKTGKGYYIHKKKREMNKDVYSMLPKPKEALNQQIAVNRMVYLMINEASKCLEEKIVDQADAIDVGMIFGTGFPAFRGGLLRYADSVGISQLIDELENLNKKTQSGRFTPSKYLINLKDTQKRFLEY